MRYHNYTCILFFQLQSDEFLNVDSILEEVLTTLVMKPLQPHLKALFNSDFERTGCLQTLRGNMAKRRGEGLPEEKEKGEAEKVRVARSSIESNPDT